MTTARTLTRVAGQLLLTGVLCLYTLLAIANGREYPIKLGMDRANPQRLLPNLSSLPIKPLKLANTTSAFVDYDPIWFSLQADKDSVKVGEEVTLTITADLLPISPAMLFFFEELRGFSLKVLFPRGFVQTGGSYQDRIGDKLTAKGKAHVV